MRENVSLALIHTINAELERLHYETVEQALAWAQIDKLNTALAQAILPVAQNVWFPQGESK